MFYTIKRMVASVAGLGDPGARPPLTLGAVLSGTERDVANDYIPIEEAARRSGLHSNTIARLLRRGVLHGYKTSQGGRARWLVSIYSLRHYTDPINGFLLDMPGPKLFLSKLHEESSSQD
jgi:hypothetical protein